MLANTYKNFINITFGKIERDVYSQNNTCTIKPKIYIMFFCF